MEKVKKSFEKIKNEICYLRREFSFLQEDLFLIKKGMVELGNALLKINEEIVSLKKGSTEKDFFSTDLSKNKTTSPIFKSGKDQFSTISTGNEGVQTDRQTDRQTDNEREILSKVGFLEEKNSFEEAEELLNSLDGLKKELRLKFKRLTKQEFLVFSTIYQLGEEKGFSTYRTLSNKIGLTESSLRDYIQRLIKKGIPIEKRKINNKEITLFVSPSLKKVASLNTIINLLKI